MEKIAALLEPQSEYPISLDLSYMQSDVEHLVVFCHGFKGFKDWGTFDCIAKEFAKNGIPFLKFNFSHNGTTAEHPTEFVDLDAFGKNTFSQELEDLNKVMDWVASDKCPVKTQNISLVGHSRGGGIAVLYASHHPISKLCTWAAVSDFGRKWDDDFLAQAKKNNGIKIKNTRTGQIMPLYYTLYQDYLDHFQKLSIPLRALQIKSPTLVVHGTEDEAVPVSEAYELHKWITGSELLVIEGANHVFGGRHPWQEETLPEDLGLVVNATIRFILQ